MINKTNLRMGSSSNISFSRVMDLINAAKEADVINYDNSVSGLTATNVQDAIDEVAGGGGSSLHADLTDLATSGHDADIIAYDNTIQSFLLATDVQGAIDEIIERISWVNLIKNRIDKLYATQPDATLTTSGATDLQTAINSLTEGQTLEIQANAVYDPITFPTNKGFTVRVKEGYNVRMTGQNCICIQNGCRNIFIQGIIFEGCTTSALNSRGSAIYLDHEAVAADIIFYQCAFSLCTGSAVMLSYHQSIGGDNYGTANAYPSEFSRNIAFVSNYFYKSCNDTTEGANISVRGILYFFAWDNVIDIADTGGRGIQCQNCIDLLIQENQIENGNAGNGELIKIDRIGSPTYFNSGHIIKNICKNGIEGVDIDDFVYGNVIGNICFDNDDEGISVDGDSKVVLIGNTCFNNTDGISLEAAATANLKSNTSFNNSSNNYLMSGGQTYDASNTTDEDNSFFLPIARTLIKPVWDDIRIIPGAFDFAGTSDPTLVNFQPGGSGTVYKLYEFGQSKEAFFTVQLPHSYKQGSNILAHIHWTPGSNGSTESGNTVAWKLDLSWVNAGSVIPSSTTYNLTDTCTGTNDLSEQTSSVSLTGTSKTISSQIIGRLYRDTGDTWSRSGSGQLPLFIELDFHFEIDTIGSKQESSK